MHADCQYWCLLVFAVFEGLNLDPGFESSYTCWVASGLSPSVNSTPFMKYMNSMNSIQCGKDILLPVPDHLAQCWGKSNKASMFCFSSKQLENMLKFHFAQATGYKSWCYLPNRSRSVCPPWPSCPHAKDNLIKCKRKKKLLKNQILTHTLRAVRWSP